MSALAAVSPIDGPEIANKRAGWRKFPMVMHHPAFKPAVVCNERQVGPDGREVWVHAPPGKPIQYPPVTVLNEAQEERHLSMGYRSSGDPKALERLSIAPPPPGYQFHEYPRMLEDGSIDEGPDAPPPPDNFYPYWVRTEGWPAELVEDREGHQALLKKQGVEEPPVPVVVDPRDEKIANLEDQLAELRLMIMAAARPVEGGTVPKAGQPAQVPPAADAAEAGISEASSEPPGQVEPTGPAAGEQLEPSAEDEIKARIAELDEELAAGDGAAEQSAAEDAAAEEAAAYAEIEAEEASKAAAAAEEPAAAKQGKRK